MIPASLSWAFKPTWAVKGLAQICHTPPVPLAPALLDWLTSIRELWAAALPACPGCCKVPEGLGALPAVSLGATDSLRVLNMINVCH